VESLADLPASLRNRADYGDLLLTFHAVHLQIESAVFTPARDQGWRQLGIDIAGHQQLELVTRDLRALGRAPQARSAGDPGPAAPGLGSRAEALGRLYVLEGSAIGRRVLSPLLHEKLGDVPSAFFDGVGRHPRAWRSVQRAIASLADSPRQRREMLTGARAAFQVFVDHLSRRADRWALSAG